MSGHRWSSNSLLCLMVILTGCQSDGSGKFAWNPFAGKRENAAVTTDDPSFSLPKFARRQDADADNSSDARPPIAAEQLERLLEQGQMALQENRLDDAQKAYTEVLNSSPDNATAHHGLAMAADLSQQWADAELHYRQALRIRPRDANLLCDLGYSYLLQNRYSEASRYLNQAIEINPQHESAHMNLAMLDLRQGNRVAAENRIAQLFGSSARAAQAIAQLESQVGVDAGSMAANAASTVLPANATIEQVQELARQERLAAERRRAAQGLPIDPQSTDRDLAGSMLSNSPMASNLNVGNPGLQFDPRTGMPLSAPNPMTNTGAGQTGIDQGGSMPHYGGPQNPQPWVNAPLSQPSNAMTAQAMPNSLNNNSGINAFNPANAGSPNNMRPVGSSMVVDGSQNYSPMNSNGNVAATNPNLTAAGAASANGSPQPMAAASGQGGSLGRVVPVHSSGTFNSPPVNGSSNSFGSPAGFSSNSGQVPVNNISASNVIGGNNSMPTNTNGMPGQPANFNSAVPAANASQMNNAQGAPQMYLDGLNVGPGALFPIGQGAPGQIQNGQMQNGTTTTNQFGAAQPDVNAVRMGNISSPGSNSMPNGISFGHPMSSLPAQDWMIQQQQQQQARQLQNSSQPSPGTAAPAWPSARPAQTNALESYERQRQQLDNDYNNALQQMDRQNPANVSRAQY